MGMTNPDGTEFYKTAGSSTDDFDGYYNVAKEAFEANFASAVETLKKYYTYDEATGEFATANGVLSIPAATYTQDETTGEWRMTPGSVTLVVTGRISASAP
jgi:oligopeptide transport system substrate-binding protein